MLMPCIQESPGLIPELPEKQILYQKDFRAITGLIDFPPRENILAILYRF